MESDETSRAYILARQVAAATSGAAVRCSDNGGPAAAADPRLGEQLAVIMGRRLSQFSMAINGIRLEFWGQDARTVRREIFIEQPTVAIGQPGQPVASCDSKSDIVATSLLSVLNQPVTEITISAGVLTVVFGTGLALRVPPDGHYESWQINSDDGLLIVCTPGGDLTIWYPPGQAAEAGTG